MPENHEKPEDPGSIAENKITNENYQEPEEPASSSSFVVRTRGLYDRDQSGGHEQRICDRIWHLGNAARADSTDASDVVEFIDRVGARQQAIIPHRDALNHPARIFEQLAYENFAVPELEPGRKQPLRDKLAKYLAEGRASPKQQFLLADRMGWHGSSFVIGYDVISHESSKGLKLTGPICRYAQRFGQGGNLDDYQHKVLRRASYSSRLMTGIALALLAPLARDLVEIGGLNFIGKAGIGKTTILRVAGSFYGGGSVPYFVPWLMTDNAPATLGLAFCDLPLLLDELDALEPDSSKAGGRLKAIVHRLCLGQGKELSHRAPGDDSARADFHLLYGSTSEHRLPDFMREGGSTMTGGQAARFVDIPADAGNGLKIFESLPKHSKTGRTPDVDQYLVRLNKACQNYHGLAGREYLRCLVREKATSPETLVDYLKKQMATFLTEVANDPKVDNRIRRRFAGLYAAGQLGLRYKILHRRCDWFMEAISACYRAATASVAGSPLSPADAAVCIAKFVQANRHKLIRVKHNGAITEETYQQAVGLIPDPNRHGKRLWLKSTVFHDNVFPDVSDSALKQLVKAQVIEKSKGGLTARQERVPGLRKDYFYVIDPEKLYALNDGSSGG
jgi:putative DNA primase/helicase